MDDALYDTLTPVLSIPRLTAPLSALLSKPPAGGQQREQLLSHAQAFRKSLGRDRPRYEDEEEREKLGGLRQCTWTRLDSGGAAGHDRHPAIQVGKKKKMMRRRTKKRKRETQNDYNDDDDDDGDTHVGGLAVSLIYEKDTFQFVIYTMSPRSSLSKRSRTAAATYQRTISPREQTAIILSKSSSAALKSFTSYLRDTFALTAIHPFEPSSSLMQSTLENYLATVCASLSGGGGSSSAQALETSFSNIIGKIELSISLSHPVAKGLKTILVTIPATAFLAWHRSVEPRGGGSRRRRKTFLESVAGWIRAKSGLGLPILFEKGGLSTQLYDRQEGDNDNDNDYDDDSPNVPPAPRDQDSPVPAPVSASTTMKISRISNEAYAISAASGLKFKSRAVHAAAAAAAVGSGSGSGSDEDENENEMQNCVRRANKDLLLAIIDHVRREQQGLAIDDVNVT